MKILKYILFFLVFSYTFLLSFPKENLFYALEKKLANYAIYVSQEQLRTNLHALIIKKPIIAYNDISLGQIEELSISSLLVHSNAVLKDAKIESKNFPILPSKIDLITISHNVFIPQKVTLHAISDLGTIHGFIDIYKQKISLQLTPHKDAKQKYPNILGYFTPQQEGIYTYEKNINLY